MSHDPCIQCGSRTGIASDNNEILIDGDAPPVTVCSYECLVEWAESNAETRFACRNCKEVYWDSDMADSPLSGPACPSCDRRDSFSI